MKTIKMGEKAKAIIGEGGQITIPIDIRRQYSLKRGDLVVFEILEGVIDGAVQ